MASEVGDNVGHQRMAVCLASSRTLDYDFVESKRSSIVHRSAFATLVLTHFVKPTAKTFSTTLKPFLIFALATSLTSSAFYMKKLRAMPKQQVITGSD